MWCRASYGDYAGRSVFEHHSRLLGPRRERGRLLGRANLGVEKLRFLFRLAMDLRHLDRRRYEHAARSLDEIGRMIGGWRKASDGKTA